MTAGPSSTYHPRTDNSGRRVLIRSPHLASPAAAWTDAQAEARAIPGLAVGGILHGLPFSSWMNSPTDDAGWEALASLVPFAEPSFDCPVGLRPAAGAVVIESDGRIWCVAPTNGFGGHEFTFPKGRTDGRSLAATAIIEVFEETGLKIRLRSYLCDVPRSMTYTRFYIAERLAGCPGDAGWETQAVVLTTPHHLYGLLTHPGDQRVLKHL